MDVKVLSSGCAACRRMVNVVNRVIARNGCHNVNVEYVQDFQRILAYSLMTTPVLVIDEEIVMVGHHGGAKIEQALQAAGAA